ncbi:MAG TPA: YggS family pyridoxal phosphate-dependent enzyme [Candidatus Acetothermia bacterium]|nr:YggS family pyridoxal phosphate-dependent enzyme [Candidatus Acetothermia bacterium]
MIEENVKRIISELPAGVDLVAAAKTRTPDEIRRAVDAGIRIIGENYVQEAEEAFATLGRIARWHFIGHLQKNKVKKAAPIFDMIETVDSVKLAELIDRECAKLDKTMPVLVEVNSGREPQKSGVLPEESEQLIRDLSDLSHIQVRGLMTMGPRFGDPELARPYFQETKRLFDRLSQLDLDNVEMRYLSMGMSNTYEIAIEEGANMVRIGTKIFGKRE